MKAANAYGVPKDVLNRRVNGRLNNLSLCGELWSKSMPGEDFIANKLFQTFFFALHILL
jgi:hypothetical protein